MPTSEFSCKHIVITQSQYSNLDVINVINQVLLDYATETIKHVSNSLSCSFSSLAEILLMPICDNPFSWEQHGVSMWIVS